MKTTTAPANAWEIRMKWGDRSLEAEVVDGRGRSTLSLGDTERDDFTIGGGAKLFFTWKEHGLDVTFSTGVAGTAKLGDQPATSLGELVERGVVKESAGQYQLSLGATDTMELQVADQTIAVNRARGRVARLGLDPWATLALVLALGLLAGWVGVTLMQMEAMNLLGPTAK